MRNRNTVTDCNARFKPGYIEPTQTPEVVEAGAGRTSLSNRGLIAYAGVAIASAALGYGIKANDPADQDSRLTSDRWSIDVLQSAPDGDNLQRITGQFHDGDDVKIICGRYMNNAVPNYGEAAGFVPQYYHVFSDGGGLNGYIPAAHVETEDIVDPCGANTTKVKMLMIQFPGMDLTTLEAVPGNVVRQPIKP